MRYRNCESNALTTKKPELHPYTVWKSRVEISCNRDSSPALIHTSAESKGKSAVSDLIQSVGSGPLEDVELPFVSASPGSQYPLPMAKLVLDLQPLRVKNHDIVTHHR